MTTWTKVEQDIQDMAARLLVAEYGGGGAKLVSARGEHAVVDQAFKLAETFVLAKVARDENGGKDLMKRFNPEPTS